MTTPRTLDDAERARQKQLQQQSNVTLLVPRTRRDAGLTGPLYEGSDYPSGPGLAGMAVWALVGAVALWAFLALVLGMGAQP